MDGLEKGAYVTLSLLVREREAGIVYSFIHPAVVAGHRASVVDRIHGIYLSPAFCRPTPKLTGAALAARPCGAWY
ncbi:MAG: hypothetical protein M3255_00545 [Pseudomonadota bacterium]|nr:hypothetical protein [Pseudomonadota bacterium]